MNSYYPLKGWKLPVNKFQYWIKFRNYGAYNAANDC